MSEYKAQIKIVDGKPQLIIHPITIETIDEQGRKGVTIKVPTLNLMSQFQEEVNHGLRHIQSLQSEPDEQDS